MEEHILMGVDVGATGFKGGLVDIDKGEMTTERLRFDTPAPATPEHMAQTFKQLVDHFEYRGPVGVGFPAIVRRGVARSAANIDGSWVGTSISGIFGEASGCDVYALNDADAAGVASMNFGVGRRELGVVLMITIGSGLGSALFIDGELVPNTELGHLYLPNQKEVVEQYVSNLQRKINNWSWRKFGKRFNRYLQHLDRLFSPDLIILGGGGSKYFTEYEALLEVSCPVKPALFLNHAGTVGAAYYAHLRSRHDNDLIGKS